MMRLLGLLAVVSLMAITGLAQDPTKVAPRAYRLEFENEWVKVVRVHYGPREKIPAHDHTKMGAAYVYLNDSGPVVFRHIGLDYGAITRPATKAGSFRLYRAVKEVHEVENPNDTPSDFMRVELKNQPVDGNSLRGRFFREDYPAGQNFKKVQFENEQIRITRLVCAPAQRLDVTASSTEPALLMALSPAHLNVVGRKGKSLNLKLMPGQISWVGKSQQQLLENTGDSPAEVLRFDFKTAPLPETKM